MTATRSPCSRTLCVTTRSALIAGTCLCRAVRVRWWWLAGSRRRGRKRHSMGAPRQSTLAASGACAASGDHASRTLRVMRWTGRGLSVAEEQQRFCRGLQLSLRISFASRSARLCRLDAEQPRQLTQNNRGLFRARRCGYHDDFFAATAAVSPVLSRQSALAPARRYPASLGS